ncbi:bromodomain-containing protein DDB_G0270170-like [Impatiens glandulifera]|uniref:bromodomain-containing protein DDB_G0270170-like n=1 Tax=Impatiens glandulifera TaxID=253017 RepID=UPI001FB15BA5|nr:bromodomain-containing protein DDB_G0270170-like [Impatiens glandulifera]
MGKVEEGVMKKRKKKGRPSLLDLQKRALGGQDKQHLQTQTLISSKPNLSVDNRRSTRRHSNPDETSPASDWVDDDGGGEEEEDEEYDDDDDERKEKKVKLVGRLPPSSSDQQHFNLSRSSANSPFSNSTPIVHQSSIDVDNHEVSAKKQKIGAAGVRSGNLHAANQDKKVQKATDTVHGSPFESGPTTPLPDKKLLVFILDRLQKKDTHGVFSEPVDTEELPDYCEIVDHPMDFGTVRRKLNEGKYTKLEEFEKDVLLICSNAMQYNAPDTIYFRQARTIQELAKRDFENLREVNEDGEPQPKVVRRGRPPSKNVKKEFTSPPPPTRVAPESSSDVATPATAGEYTTNSNNNYNLRKGPMSYKFQANDVYLRTTNLSASNDLFNDMTSDWNSEFPASVLKAEAKHTKKTVLIDENRRGTYNLSPASTYGHEPYLLSSPVFGDMNRLVGMGLNVEHGYSRSLARFASDLGPVGWKIASKKIERALPPGVKFGRGWVGENEVSSNNIGMNSALASSRSCEAAPAASSGGGPIVIPTQQPRNGYNNNASMLGCDNSSQSGGIVMRPEEEDGLVSRSINNNNNNSSNSMMIPGMAGGNNMFNGGYHQKYKQQQQQQQNPDLGVVPSSSSSSAAGMGMLLPPQYSLPVPPDLNAMIFQGSDLPPGLGLHSIGSPKQPDLALQL